MSISGVPFGADRIHEQLPKIVTISEPGYYRIGKDVHTITCTSGKFTIVERGGMGSLLPKMVYAPDPQTEQWIEVTKNMLKSGPLQFEISCLEGAQDDQLLMRDTAKESAVAEAIARMRVGVSAQAEQVGSGRFGISLDAVKDVGGSSLRTRQGV